MLTYLFMICACGGGAIVVGQLLLSVLAMGAGHGLHFHHHGGSVAAHHGAGSLRGGHHRPGLGHARAHGMNAAIQPGTHATAGAQPHHSLFRDHWAVSYLLGIFNFQGITAGATVLGLAGLAASAASLPTPLTLTIAGVSAIAMMLLVGGLLQVMISMDQDGTVQIDRAIGQVGTVYLTIPAGGEQPGKISLPLQQQLMEFSAITRQSTALAVGEKVIVISVRKPSLMEVVSADKYLRDVEPLKDDSAAS